MGQTIFVKNTGKSTSRCLLLLMFIFKIIHCIHTTIHQKCIHQTPSFPTVTLLFSTRNSSLWEVRGGHRLHFCVLSSNPSGPWLVPDLSSLPSIFLALQASDLWPTAQLPSKPNSHLERIQNNLR